MARLNKSGLGILLGLSLLGSPAGFNKTAYAQMDVSTYNSFANTAAYTAMNSSDSEDNLSTSKNFCQNRFSVACGAFGILAAACIIGSLDWDKIKNYKKDRGTDLKSE